MLNTEDRTNTAGMDSACAHGTTTLVLLKNVSLRFHLPKVAVLILSLKVLQRKAYHCPWCIWEVSAVSAERFRGHGGFQMSTSCSTMLYRLYPGCRRRSVSDMCECFGAPCACGNTFPSRARFFMVVHVYVGTVSIHKSHPSTTHFHIIYFVHGSIASVCALNTVDVWFAEELITERENSARETTVVRVSSKLHDNTYTATAARVCHLATTRFLPPSLTLL